MKILQQRREVKQLEIELEHKRLLCEVEAKWKKIIGTYMPSDMLQMLNTMTL